LEDILKVIYQEKKLDEFLESHCDILLKNGLKYLEQWKDLTEEDKDNLCNKSITEYPFPIPLRKLLDKVVMQGNYSILLIFIEPQDKKRPRGTEIVEIQQKFALLLKFWSRNGLVVENQNYFYVKREKIMQEFYKQLIRPNEMIFYVYHGPRASGKSSLMKTLDPPPNGITIMYVLYLFLNYLGYLLKLLM
jgi:hypothetical protein